MKIRRGVEMAKDSEKMEWIPLLILLAIIV
jgi:hypothetical protein